MLSRNFPRFVMLCAAVFMLASCATGPNVRSDAAQNINFTDYRTFSFMAEPATDKAGYTTLITQHFKDAITEQMTALGYQYSENNADLLINFNSNVESRTEVRSMPTATMHYGYYHYRRGIYVGFPVYTQDVDTVHYKVGTVNIDVVDANKKQLIWEGIAEGTLKKSDLQQPKQAISNVVSLIFEQFPTHPAHLQQ